MFGMWPLECDVVMTEKTMAQMIAQCDAQLGAAMAACPGSGEHWALFNSVQALLWGLKDCVVSGEEAILKDAGSYMRVAAPPSMPLPVHDIGMVAPEGSASDLPTHPPTCPIGAKTSLSGEGVSPSDDLPVVTLKVGENGKIDFSQFDAMGVVADDIGEGI